MWDEKPRLNAVVKKYAPVRHPPRAATLFGVMQSMPYKNDPEVDGLFERDKSTHARDIAF
jgi:hypothetical protein